MATATVLAAALLALSLGGAAGGVMVMDDLSHFELEVKVKDVSGNPIAGASVVIRDASGAVVASGLTNEEGEYELEVDHDGAEDSEGDEDFDDDGISDHEDSDDFDASGLLSAASEDDSDGDDDEDEDETDFLGTLEGPLTIEVSKEGYQSATLTVDLNALDDEHVLVTLLAA